MSIEKISITYSDGSIYWVDDKKFISDIKKIIPSTISWKKTGTIKELRNKYFGMISKLNKDINTGYTNAGLHEALKPILFAKLRDFSHVFKDNIFEVSTQHLTIEGWQMLLSELEDAANDIFSYTFNNI